MTKKKAQTKQEPTVHKTTQKEFDIFKKSFTEWQLKFGLTQYRIDFELKKLDEAFGTINVNHSGRTATISCASEILPGDVSTFNPKATGAHEAMHLLLWNMFYLATCRYTTHEEIMEEWEALVRRLEHAFGTRTK